jgi:hypothetical protein
VRFLLWIENCPRSAARLIPYSVGLSSALVAAVVVAQRLLQVPREGTEFLLHWCGWAAAGAFALWIVVRFVRLPSPVTLKPYLLAVQAGMLGLFVPTYLYVWRSPWENYDWDGFFLNKRWLLALYWLAIATFLVLPHLISRSTKEAALLYDRGSVSGLRGLALKMFACAALAWYFAGPPWHLERNHREIDSHEQVNLGPLQAIEKGFLPYTGPASSQYGPGSQMLTFAVMKWSGHFDLLSYREAGALLHLLTAFGICLTAALFLDGWMLVPVLLLALAYSPLGFFYYQPNGTLEGFYGWANGLRYLGATLFLGGLPTVLRARPAAALPLGASLGLFCFMSQENLSTAVNAAALLLVLLRLTGTESAATIGRGIARAIGGFAAVWVPVLIVYAAHAALGALLHGYLLFGAAVAHGFLNSWWLSPTDSLQYRAYLYTGVLLIAIGIGTLFNFQAGRLRGPLDRRQSRLLAFVCAAAAAYSVSLFRSDTWHQRNTTAALPYVLLLTFWDLPQWTVRAGWPRWILRSAIAGVALWVYPLLGDYALNIAAELRAPMRRFAAYTMPPLPPADPRIPFQRVTRYLSDEPLVCQGSVAMRAFLEEMSALREIVGMRRTMVTEFPGLFPGVVNFVADLNPAPHFLAREMLMPNTHAESLAWLKAHIAGYECIITDDLNDPEAAAFRQQYPNAKVVTRALGEDRYYIVLR